MSFDADALAAFVATELRARASPADAAKMQAYLKTTMPFFGVKRPARQPVVKAAKTRFAPTTPAEYRAGVLALWALPHREEKYTALDWALAHKRLRTTGQLDLYERLVREGGWWDLVDPVATDLIGRLHLAHRDKVQPVIERWIDDDDVWIRRTAILSQLKHKQETDAALLFAHCRARAHESEFFIRKAIGWALREYSKTDPDAVRAFIDANEDALSGLSKREGRRRLDG